MHIKEINELARFILSCFNMRTSLGGLLADLDYFDDVYGFLSEENAVSLIRQSKWNHCVASLLPQLFQFSNEYTISDAVFEMLKAYPHKKIQKSIFISLAHCSISLYQLQYISQQKVCVEAFAALLDIYLEEKCFSCIDLKKLLADNAAFVPGIDWENILRNGKLDDAKREVVKAIWER